MSVKICCIFYGIGYNFLCIYHKTKSMSKYEIVIEKDESGFFVGEVKWLKSAYTQAKTLPELFERLFEVSEWSMEILQDISVSKVPKQPVHFSLMVSNA